MRGHARQVGSIIAMDNGDAYVVPAGVHGTNRDIGQFFGDFLFDRGLNIGRLHIGHGKNFRCACLRKQQHDCKDPCHSFLLAPCLYSEE